MTSPVTIEDLDATPEDVQTLDVLGAGLMPCWHFFTCWLDFTGTAW